MADPPPSELETVAALRLAIRRLLRATDEVTATHGLTPRQYDLLALLHQPSASSAPTPTRIAEQLALSRSATTELLTRAANAGLVERGPDPTNARTKHVTPTEAGTTRFFAAVAELRAERHRLFELLRVAAGLAGVLSAAQ